MELLGYAGVFIVGVVAGAGIVIAYAFYHDFKDKH